MGKVGSKHGRYMRRAKFLQGNQKRTDNTEVLGIDGRIILE
jgi:hypothetical protein